MRLLALLVIVLGTVGISSCGKRGTLEPPEGYTQNTQERAFNPVQ